MYLSQSVFSQRQSQDKDQLAHALYAPGAATAQTNLYGTTIPTVTGLSTGMPGLSIHPGGSRGLGSASQYGVSRANTAPAGYGGMPGVGTMSQLQVGAPSPPPARGGILPLGSGRAGLIGTGGQGIVGAKSTRPSTLSQAIGSALPMNAYGGLGRSSQGMMSPMTSGYGTAFSDASSQGFDPSDFPVLSFGNRARHDSSNSLTTTSTTLPIRPGYALHDVGDHENAGRVQLPRQMPDVTDALQSLGRRYRIGFDAINSPLLTGGQLPKPSESVPGFQMHSEDFPALPGTSTKVSDSSDLSQDSKFSGLSTSLPEPRSYDLAPGSNKERSGTTAPIGPPKGSTKRSIQPSTVSIPPGMVQDQFGMMGLLTFIRGAETDPNLVALALGSDLTTLGLNLNSPESLYNTFASPWADSPCRPQDIDYNVPQEYLIHAYVREKLAPIRLTRYNEDLLFYLYYTNGGDLLQVLSASELYARDWRYHKEERLWITRAPGMRPTKQETTFEEGTYCYFDVNTWRKAHKEFHVEYDKLEDRPQMPPNVITHQGLTSIPTQA